MAFEAQKLESLEERRGMRKMGRFHVQREIKRAGFKEQRDRIMLDILRAKFSVKAMAIGLLQTGDEELVNRNLFNDVYWGVNKEGKGYNKLGRLLMRVRSEIRER
jgi:predicted NAD-dependent protein-ADP-ribosyltransferase YbiA (DUF1768 family)